NNLKSVAFCCISTGEFHFPNEEAAKIAIGTVQEFLEKNKINIKVVFNVFKDKDYEIYKRLLG
ncbi:macro domain-containing protein, partial [Fusobacterium nucleatum]